MSFLVILMVDWLVLGKASRALDQSVYDDTVRLKAAESSRGHRLVRECVPFGINSQGDEECSLNPGRLLSGSMYPKEIDLRLHDRRQASSSFETGFAEKMDPIALRASNCLSVINCAKSSCLTAARPSLAPVIRAQVGKCAALQATNDAWASQRDSMSNLMNSWEQGQNQILQSASELTTSLREDVRNRTQLLQSQRNEAARLRAELGDEGAKRATAVANEVAAQRDTFNNQVSDLERHLGVGSREESISAQLSSGESYESAKQALADLYARRGRLSLTKTETLEKLMAFKRDSFVVVDNDKNKREEMARIFEQMNTLLDGQVHAVQELIVNHFGFQGNSH